MATNKKIPKCPPLRFPQFNDKWKFATISEVCKTSTGSMNTQDKIEGGAYPFYVRSSTIERANKYTYDGIAILTPGDGAIGKVFHYSEGKIAVHQRVYILSDITIGTKYLFYYFSDKFYNRVMRLSAKNTVDSVRMNMITDMPISLPSLAEQEKIAGFLSLIDERIQLCSETIKERKREKAALLNQLFSQKLRFPQFSDEWQQTMLGEIAEILNSRRKPITSSDRVRGDYPYYGASGIIDYVNEYIFDEQLLLIGEDGAKWGKYEKTAFIVNGRCWVNNHAHVLRFQNYPTYKLIEAFFFSLNLKPFVTGDAPPKLTLENLKSILIHFPSLAEQKKIADFLSLIDERIEAEEELLEQYERQKRYLLKQMFI